MFAAVLLATSMALDTQAHLATQAVNQHVLSSLRREYCTTYFELRDREAKRKQGLLMGPENDLAIERLRNRKAQLRREIDKIDEQD